MSSKNELLSQQIKQQKSLLGSNGIGGILNRVETPYNSLKSANQFVEFSMDPSKGLSRKRFMWRSNNVAFDNTFFQNTSVPGSINIQTGSTGTDTAILRSSFSGRYQSQTFAVPGQAAIIDSSNVNISSDNKTSITNGIVAIGAGLHYETNGGWNIGLNDLRVFIGLKFTPNGVFATLISDGSEIRSVHQSRWNINKADGSGPNGVILDPSRGYVYNQPYTWYNQGALFVGFVDPDEDRLIPVHKFVVDGKPSMSDPNIHPIVILDNNGDASPIEVNVGGLQYSRYGTGEEVRENRQTAISRESTGGFISNTRVLNNNAVDVGAEPGVPLISFRRKPDSRGVTTSISRIKVNPDNEIYLIYWDEFDESTALTTPNFRNLHNTVSNLESKMEVDTEATDYTPSTNTIRGFRFIEGGSSTNSKPSSAIIEDRVPIGATRVITAVNTGTAADVAPLQIEIQEGY